eukprot:UC4_evm1s476
MSKAPTSASGSSATEAPSASIGMSEAPTSASGSSATEAPSASIGMSEAPTSASGSSTTEVPLSTTHSFGDISTSESQIILTTEAPSVSGIKSTELPKEDNKIPSITEVPAVTIAKSLVAQPSTVSYSLETTESPTSVPSIITSNPSSSTPAKSTPVTIRPAAVTPSSLKYHLVKYNLTFDNNFGLIGAYPYISFKMELMTSILEAVIAIMEVPSTLATDLLRCLAGSKLEKGCRIIHITRIIEGSIIVEFEGTKFAIEALNTVVNGSSPFCFKYNDDNLCSKPTLEYTLIPAHTTTHTATGGNMSTHSPTVDVSLCKSQACYCGAMKEESTCATVPGCFWVTSGVCAAIDDSENSESGSSASTTITDDGIGAGPAAGIIIGIAVFLLGGFLHYKHKYKRSEKSEFREGVIAFEVRSYIEAGAHRFGLWKIMQNKSLRWYGCNPTLTRGLTYAFQMGNDEHWFGETPAFIITRSSSEVDSYTESGLTGVPAGPNEVIYFKISNTTPEKLYIQCKNGTLKPENFGLISVVDPPAKSSRLRNSTIDLISRRRDYNIEDDNLVYRSPLQATEPNLGTMEPTWDTMADLYLQDQANDVTTNPVQRNLAVDIPKYTFPPTYAQTFEDDPERPQI